MISANTVITFDVAGSSSLFPHTPDGIRQDAITALTATFDVIDVSITTPSFTDDPLRMFKGVQYQAVVIASPRADYGDMRDVDSLVANAFYDAAGEVPTVKARGWDPSAGAPNKQTPGLSLTTGLALGVVGVAALAVIAVSK